MTGITGAVATPHHLATAAGERAYRNGGNAIDAALAAAAVLTVVYPHNTALGGDLVALVRTPDGAITCVNATGTAPAARSLADLRARHGDRLPTRGPDTITVPGVVRGWEALRRRGAALSWADQFASAIGHAADGVPIARSLGRALAAERVALAADPGCRAVFTAGDTLVQPNLAATLRTLATDGPDAFYTGPIAGALAGGLKELGCPMTVDDLAGYAPRVTDAIAADFAGHRVHTSPPNTQGFMLLRTLRAVTALGRDTADVLVPLFLDGIRVRETLLADPDFAATDLDDGFDEIVARLVSAGAPAVVPAAKGDTVGIAAADSSGYAVSLIQSVFDSFGAAVLEPATGILMQNRGTGFSLDPASPNVIEPGKRPKHTLMPVLVTRGGALRWVSATMGGHGQPQIHAQVLLHLLAGRSPQAAVSAPRWVAGAREPGQATDIVHYEADLDGSTVDLLAGFPLAEVPARTEFLGHTNVVSVEPDGTFTAGSDPRSDGSAAVI
jgi:gamma-glutamyltranspeptidase/glutathione hydrolase